MKSKHTLFTIIILIVATAFVALSPGTDVNGIANAAELSQDYLSQWFDAPEFLDYETTKARIESAVLRKDNLADYLENPIVVAVIDTGVMVNHPVFQDVLYVNSAEANGQSGIDDDGNGMIDDKCGWDFVGGDADVSDTQSNTVYHGTHVAGILAKQIINYGLEDYIKILPIRAGTSYTYLSSTRGSFSASAVAAAINYANSIGADVINLSINATPMGANGFATGGIVDRAVQAAYAAGAIIVAAAGNDGRLSASIASSGSPSGLENVIGVMAYGVGHTLLSSSNYGAAYDVVAPGANILSAYGTTGYETKGGTSMATSIVSFMAAVMLLRYDRNYGAVYEIFEFCVESRVSGYPEASLKNYLEYSVVEGVNISLTDGTLTQKITSLNEVGLRANIRKYGESGYAPLGDETYDLLLWDVVECDSSGNAISGGFSIEAVGGENTFKFTPPQKVGYYKISARIGQSGVRDEILLSVGYASRDEVSLNVICDTESLRAGEKHVFTLSGYEYLNPLENVVQWRVYDQTGKLVKSGFGGEFVFSVPDSGKYELVCTLNAATNIVVGQTDLRVGISAKQLQDIISGVVSAVILAAILGAMAAAVYKIVKAKMSSRDK